MNVKEAIKYGIDNLKNIDDKSLKVRLILSHFMNVEKNYLITHDDEELSEEIEEKYKLGIEKLSKDVPLQYITNTQEFYGMKFKVNENVLIPRYDTEILIEETLKLAKDKDKILDMCTGSGIIAITLAKNVEKANVFACDISLEALKVAKENNELHNTNVKFINSNLFENIEEKNFDIIVSNPPYIPEKEMQELENQVKKEPELALYGGVDGLDFYKKITENAKEYLKKEGLLIFEIGYKQKEDVSKILIENKFKNIKCVKDLQGLDRVIIGEKE